MKKQHQKLLFALLFLVSFLVIFLQVKAISSTDQPSFSSFYGLRQIEHIQKTGLPIIFDSLSYQGRANTTQVGFYYLMALFAFIFPLILISKFINLILLLVVVFLVYFTANKLFANKIIVWLLTLMTLLSPILFTAHINNFDPGVLFAILLLLILNVFFTLKKETSLLFIFLILLSTLISSLSLIFIPTFIIYVILMTTSSKKLSSVEAEVILFSTVFIAWLHFIIYKESFLEYGVSLFQKSIPSVLFANSFYGLTISVAISIVGLIPLLLGVYGTYLTLFKEPTKKNLLIISFLFSFILALSAGFISFTDGFFYITLLLILLSGVAVKEFNGFLNKTVFQKLKPLFFIFLVFLIVLNFMPVTNYGSVVNSQAPTPDELKTMSYLANNTPIDSTVLSTIKEGYLISSEANRKNFYDENFIFAPQANQRYMDAKKMFLSKSQMVVLEQMRFYGIDYVYESPQTLKEYPLSESVFESGDCFEKVFETNTTRVFKLICKN